MHLRPRRSADRRGGVRDVHPSLHIPRTRSQRHRLPESSFEQRGGRRRRICVRQGATASHMGQIRGRLGHHTAEPWHTIFAFGRRFVRLHSYDCFWCLTLIHGARWTRMYCPSGVSFRYETACCAPLGNGILGVRLRMTWPCYGVGAGIRRDGHAGGER